MTYYYETKQQALDAASAWERDPKVRAITAELEPYNGWVIVLYPALHDLSEYEDRAEIRDGRPHRRPVARNRPPQPPTARRGRQSPSPQGEAPARPERGATARVWAVADEVAKKDGWTRADVIEACAAAGINKSTASTQYSKWRRARESVSAED